MAFRQPTALPRRQSQAIDRSNSHASQRRPGPTTRPVDDTHEWVLFSPSQARTASCISTETTPRMTGVSRLSDFGSWNAGAKEEEALSDATHDADEADDLDSLDEGLQAFREPALERRLDQSGGSILPGHDGLGGFAASSQNVQEHLFDFEPYNRQRRQSYGHHRTTSSLQRQLDALDEGIDESTHLDKTRRDRIEKWRLDSSRIISEELEREARSQNRRATRPEAALGNIPQLSDLIEGHLQGDNDETTQVSPHLEDESLWQRITRRVVEDLIGIDDGTLAIIVGECLPDDGDDVLSTTPTPPSRAHLRRDDQSERSHEGWQNLLIKRLAKEIGMLARYLTNTQPSLNSEPLASTMDYAGIPIAGQPASSGTQHQGDSAQFLPTIRNRQIPFDHAANGHRSLLEDPIAEPSVTPIPEAEFWDQKPDLRAVFDYLSRRFMSRRYTSSVPTVSNVATTHTEDSLNRAAIIQKHHPLVSRARANTERRGRRSSFRLSSQLGARSVALSPSLKRAGTSCASWSTKRHKVGASENGSRNYWDIGGSIGSENAALGGVWGEV
jgi:hypothetical protein